jgi:hypothetical protein
VLVLRAEVFEGRRAWRIRHCQCSHGYAAFAHPASGKISFMFLAALTLVFYGVYLMIKTTAKEV